MLFFDPVVNRGALESVELDVIKPKHICSHCFKPITGKVHREGMRYYDEYCWQLRYILGFGEDVPENNKNQKG